MTRRSRDQLERDRADLLAALEEAGHPLRPDAVIARTLGYTTSNALWEAYTAELWQQVQQGLRDLAALRRKGVVHQWTDPNTYRILCRLATDEDADAEDDRVEVERMLGRWEPAS